MLCIRDVHDVCQGQGGVTVPDFLSESFGLQSIDAIEAICDAQSCA